MSLANALHAQQVVNDTIAARKAAEKAEAAKVLAAIHEAFATEESAVLGLLVRSYYTQPKPINIADLTESTGPMRTTDGLKVPVYRAHDGHDLLRVTVCARDDQKAGYIKLAHVPSRGWVARGETAKLDLTYDLFVPPAELLDRLYAELAKYVV
jgi:hypothetical protein